MPRLPGLFYAVYCKKPTKPRVVMANPVGRPTKYNDEIQRQADEYLSRLEELSHVVPSRAGLCCYLGIAKSTSYLWEEQYPEFSDSLRAVEVMQEHMTLNGSLANQLNPTIAKLVLSNNHGYSEQQRVDHTSAGNEIKTFAAMYAHQPKNDDSES